MLLSLDFKTKMACVVINGCDDGYSDGMYAEQSAFNYDSRFAPR